MAATWTIESLERTFELNEESQPLDTSALEDFVAYADVTEEVALGWLMDSEEEGFQDVVEAKIAAQIEEQSNPTSGSGIPWAVVEEVEEEEAAA